MNIVKSKILWPFFSVFMLSSMWVLLFLNKSSVIFLEMKILSSNSADWNMILMFDFTAAIFAASVALIASAVFIFSSSYMHGLPRTPGFYMLVNLFVLSMFLLLASPNLFSGMVGWDGLGMVSFLLVIFYGSSKAFNSGVITALSNRVGDLLIIGALSVVIFKGSPEIKFFTFFELPLWSTLVLVIATTTKSAQVPFSAWLPAAMAAPTPVSALVHSSTLVTAGVYLMIRHSVIRPCAQDYILLVSIITSWVASTMALVEPDLKKIVALSTLSQLGVMMTMVGVNMKELALAHLLAHAFFKAMIFIATGSIIHNNSGYQDTRWTASFSSFYSASSSFMLASASLSGVPLMSAFFSKEALVEYMLMASSSFTLGFMFIMSIFLTSAYSVRLITMLFLNNPLMETPSFRSDGDELIVLALSMLLMPASIGGWAIYPNLFNTSSLGESTFEMKLMTIVLVLAGILGSMRLLTFRGSFPMWGLTEMTSHLPKSFQQPSHEVVKTIDRGFLISLVPAKLSYKITSTVYAADPASLIKLSLLSVLAMTLFLVY